MRRFYAFNILRFCRLSLSALFVLSALCTLGQRPASEKPVVGKVRVKVTEAFSTQLETASQARVRTADGVLTTGHPALDAVSRQYKATNIRRVFRPAGKFEARHRKHGLHLWYEIDIDTTVSAQAAALSFGNIAAIQRAETVHKKTLQKASIIRTLDGAPEGWDGSPDDTHFSKQWHYENTGQSGGKPGADIRLREAWKIEAGKPNVIVSVIDENIDYNHRDLAANMWVNPGEIAGNNQDDDHNGFVDDIHGYSFADNSGTFVGFDHGTHVAGTIGAVTNNGTGVAGVAGGSGQGDGVRLMATGVAGIYGSGGFEEAYVYAADNGAVISQNSWSYGAMDYYEESVRVALDYFIEEAGKDEHGVQTGPMAGGIVIFSAGNENYHGNFYPAYFEDVIAVAATSDLDTRASYSNFGSWIDIAAPGGDFFGADHPERYVLSTVTGDRYSYFDGTSQACPHVSGVAALLISKFGGPGFTPAMLRKRLIESTDNIDALNPDYAGELGTGRLNAYKALLQNDVSAPETIATLSVSDVNVSSISLTWTSPEDGTSSAYSYEMRYSKTPITDANFTAATLVTGLPLPGAAGQTESWTITGLQPEQKYYVALRAADLLKNTSPLSNVVEATTSGIPALEFSPTQFSLDLVTAQVVTEYLTLTNTGNGPLRFTIAVPPHVTSSVTTGAIAPGDQLVVHLTADVHGVAGGQYTGPVMITTNEPTGHTHTLGFTLKVTDLGLPLAEASVSSIDFGDVFRGGRAIRSIVLTNAGTEPLQITGVVATPARFSTDFAEAVTLDPLDQVTLEVTFAPTAAAAVNGMLTVSTNDPSHEALEIDLTGKGIPAPNIAITPATITKSLTSWQTGVQNLRITNTGGNPLEFAIGASFEVKSTARVKVAILTSDFQVREFENFLNSLPHVQAEVYQHNNLPKITADDLKPFDIVLVTNESEWLYEGGTSPVRIGNVLADYIDQGGKVIVNSQVYDNTGWGLKGRFIDEQYGPFFKSSSMSAESTELGEIEVKGHPLLEDVSTLAFNGYTYDLETSPGSTVVARWSNGRIMVATRGNVVAFNMVASSSGQVSAIGDAAPLYENAIRYILGQTVASVDIGQGTIAAGDFTDLEVTFDASAYGTGTYTGNLNIYTNAPNKEKVLIPVTLNVSGPDLGFSAAEIVEEAHKGETKTQQFTITNKGTTTIDYTVSVENADVVLDEPDGEQGEEAGRSALSVKRTFPDRTGWTFTPSSPNVAQLPGLFEASANQRTAGKTSYATGFENIASGSIDKQDRWNGMYAYGLFTVESKNPANGLKHMRGTSDGMGQALVVSPLVSVSGAAEKTSGSMRVNLAHAFGEEWQMWFQTGYDGLAVVGVMLKPDGKLYATVTPGLGANLFIPTDMLVDVPEGYFNLAVEVEKGTGTFSVFIDGRKVFTGQGGHDSIDNIYIYSPMTKAGPYIDIDDLQILEGGYQELSSYLTVSTVSGTLAAGASRQIQATFNASTLSYGTYGADIVVTAAGIQDYTIPTTFTVNGDPDFELKGIAKVFHVGYGEDSVQRFTVMNTGGHPLTYNIVVDEATQAFATFSPHQGTIPVGGQRQIAVQLFSSTLDAGEYKVPFVVQSNAGDDRPAELSIGVLDPAVLNLPVQAVNIVEPEGSSLVGTFTVANGGLSTLKFRMLLGTGPWDGSLNAHEGFDPANFGPLDGSNAIVSSNQVPGTQKNYRMMFEELSYGLITDQHGWYAAGSDWELYDDWGAPVIRQLSPGNGTPTMLFSPVVNTSESPVSSLDMIYLVNRNANATYQFIAQSKHEGKIVTRLQIDKTGIWALTRQASGAAGFVRLDDAKIGEYPFAGYYTNIQISVVKATGVFKIYVDGVLIFEGQGFAGNIDQFVVYSTNEDPDYEHAIAMAAIGTSGAWLKMEPALQPVLTGAALAMPLTVDTHGLPGGVYEETIRITSNDPARRQVLIPLNLSVITPAIGVNADLTTAKAETGRQASDKTVTISNGGDGDLSYIFLGYGLGAESMNLPRVSTVHAASGGPDGQGYYWTTSESEQGPVFEWNDISTTGRKLMLRGSAIKPVDIPFGFPYYGVVQSRVAITSWGCLMFGVEQLSDLVTSEFEYIRHPSTPNNFISAAGQYIRPDKASGIYYLADDEKLIVQYSDVPSEYFPSVRNTYQVVLYKDGAIKFIYKTLSYTYGVIGMENADASEGLQLDYLVNWGRPAENVTVLIQPAAAWILPLAPEGTIAPGGSMEVPISFDASTLQPGEYHTTLFVGSNDPSHRATAIPVVFTVSEKLTTGTIDEQNSAFRVYPVPSDNTVTVEIRKPTSKGAVISIGNTQGQQMYQVEVPAGTIRHQINLNDVNAAKGLYILKVDAGNWSEVKKVIKR